MPPMGTLIGRKGNAHAAASTCQNGPQGQPKSERKRIVLPHDGKDGSNDTDETEQLRNFESER
jgi:hypothetical protein